MHKLPIISGVEARKVFERAGWRFVRVGSSRHYDITKGRHTRCTFYP